MYFFVFLIRIRLEGVICDMQFVKRLINTIKEHFRLKLIICFILCAIFPLFILGTISYKISYNIAKDNMLKETKIACEKNQNLLENRMTQIESLADSIHFNLCVLCTTPEQPMSKYLDTISSVRNNITSMADSFNIYHVNVFLRRTVLCQMKESRFVLYRK